ncbi:hypothetical protein MLD38_035890 [Melastoma candidum]|uniref:Uncharacterized protein n=1 Tax=Melastoma candidum TaxID=119954 RepID=A0ACB9LI89_9MYRT|nr:hypothetical protein MLD38_035890 [Melastoma candidum]
MAGNFTPGSAGLTGNSAAGLPSSASLSTSIPSPIQLPASIFSTTLKLDEGNYTLWKGQVLAAIIAGGYEEFVYGTSQPPSNFLDELMTEVNPEFKLWQRTDKSVMSFLFSTLTQEPLSQVVCCTSSHEVWESLWQRFESNSTTRIINLRMQMQQVRKDGRTMQNYLNSVKMYADQLSAIGEPVRYRDHLWYLLEGLPAEYDPVVTAVYSRTDQPSIEEVHQLLLNFDLRLERRQVLDPILPQVQFSAASSGAGQDDKQDRGTGSSTPRSVQASNSSNSTPST